MRAKWDGCSTVKHDVTAGAASVILAILFGASVALASTAAQAACAGYDSQVWAQSVFDTDPTRYAALDPDGNGLACEELPPGAAPALWTDAVPADAEPATLAGVTDGDTIRAIVGGVEEPVRLILVDTPETRDPDDPPECYGAEATAFTTWLFSLDGDVYLETDVTDRDRFGRLLRYAWLDFGGGEVYLVNEAIVRAGYGALSTFPPDVEYVEEVREAAAFARDHGYGLWSGCVADAEGDTNELQAPPSAPESAAVAPAAEPAPAPAVGIAAGCDPSYPDACIPPAPPDLDCGEISPRRFTVLPPDPHGFDGDFDGVGCESG